MDDAKPAPTFAGHNEIRLNEATMKQIVEFWLAHKWTGEPPHVDGVKAVPDNASGSHVWFLVTLRDPAP